MDNNYSNDNYRSNSDYDSYNSGSYGNYNSADNYSSYEEKEAPSFFMQFPYSFNPQKYGELVRVKNGPMIGFVILFLALCTIVTYIGFSISFSKTEEIEKVLNMFPDFCLTNGEFSIEETFEYADSDKEIYVLVSDEVDEFKLDEAQEKQEEGYDSVILIGQSNLVFENDGEYNQLKFSDLPEVTFNKEWIMDTFLPGLFVVVSIGFIFYFIGRTLWYFFCALMYMLIAMICAKIFHKEFTSGVLYKTAIYAKVIMTVVACLLSVLPIAVAIPAFIRTMITLAMMLVSFTNLPQRSDV